MGWTDDYSWFSRNESPPSWSIEFGLSERDYPTFDDYMRTWGDEPRWTSMLLYGWKTCTKPALAPTLAIQVSQDGTVEGTDQNIGLFSMSLHLLALGMGWTDVAAGLRHWRSDGYQQSHHVILDYLMSALGPDALIALEILCGVVPDSELHHGLDYLANYPAGPALAEADPQMISRYEELARARHREGILVLPWDNLHLTGHVGKSIAGGGGGIQPPRFALEVVQPRHLYKLNVETYAAWAFALAAAERDLHVTGEPMVADDIEIDVHVAPIGHLGTFLKAHDTNRWFLTTRDVPLSAQFTAHRWGQAPSSVTAQHLDDSSPTVSPRFGFDLIPSMPEVLAPLMADFESWEDRPVERIEVLYKEAVDRSHFLVYWIEGELSQEQMAWTRVNGNWVNGMYAPEGHHYMSCLAQMLEEGHLPLDEAPLDPMLEDSPILEAQDWAGDLLIRIWDSLEYVPSIIGRLGVMDEEVDVEAASLADSDRTSLERVLQEKWSRIVSSDEREGLEALEAACSGGTVNVRQLLESVAY